MKLIDTLVEGAYTTNIYDNGTRERFPTGSPPRIVQPPILTEDQQIAHEMAANIEMLAALAEIG